jgi:hypothetical protein
MPAGSAGIQTGADPQVDPLKGDGRFFGRPVRGKGDFESPEGFDE